MGILVKLLGLGSWLIAGTFLAFLVPGMDRVMKILIFVAWGFPVVVAYAHSIARARRRTKW